MWWIRHIWITVTFNCILCFVCYWGDYVDKEVTHQCTVDKWSNDECWVFTAAQHQRARYNRSHAQNRGYVLSKVWRTTLFSFKFICHGDRKTYENLKHCVSLYILLRVYLSFAWKIDLTKDKTQRLLRIVYLYRWRLHTISKITFLKSVGFKQTVGRLVQQENWLVRNTHAKCVD